MREVNFLFLLVSIHKIFFFDILARIYTTILAISSRMRTFTDVIFLALIIIERYVFESLLRLYRLSNSE